MFTLGMARTFQQLRLITRLSVLDNIMLSFPSQSGERVREIFFFPGRIKEQEKRNEEKAVGLLRDMGVEEKAHALVEDLSYGQQKMVSLACCLASDADLLLLDEPVAGINPESKRSRVQSSPESKVNETKITVNSEPVNGYEVFQCPDITICNFG